MRWLIGSVVVAALAVPSLTHAQTPAQTFARVRGSSPVIVEAIEQGAVRSPTFNQLVTAIAATDGIVYVHSLECGRRVLACLVLSVTKAGPHRILQIRIDPRRTGDGLVVSIGHELKHALELLAEPTAVNYATAHGFYERIAPTARLSFETRAALETGWQIADELKRWAKP